MAASAAPPARRCEKTDVFRSMRGTGGSDCLVRAPRSLAHAAYLENDALPQGQASRPWVRMPVLDVPQTHVRQVADDGVRGDALPAVGDEGGEGCGHGQLDVSGDRVGHQVGAAEHQEHPDLLAHGRGAGPLRLLSWAVVDIGSYTGSHVRSQP